jgi:hypothetical protein
MVENAVFHHISTAKMVKFATGPVSLSWLLYSTVSLLLLLGLFYGSQKSSRDLLAVILETDPPSNLAPITLHFASVLGPRWKVVIYTLERNWVVPQSAPFRRALDAGNIQIRYLPRNTDFSDGHKVSEFLTRPWLWEQLQDAAHVLMFQLDSIICANSEKTVDDFLHFDFVGAPIVPERGRGYNGGLSLRNPRLFLDIAREEVMQGEGILQWEDQWFYHMAEKRVENGVRLATPDEAKLFSVETLYYDKPLGYHQAPRWQASNIAAIMEWCPEVGMAGEKRTPPS